MKANKAKFWLLGIVILIQALPALPQNTRRNNRNTPKPNPVDTIAKPPAPAMLLPGNNCNKGITNILIEIAPADTATVPPTWIYIYAAPTAVAENDTQQTSDTILPYRITKISDIEKNNYHLYIDKPGLYYVRTAAGNPNNLVFSERSDTVAAKFCSLIEFQPVFDRLEMKAYIPGPFVNIQIQEFDIFDRIGNPAYHHNNNNINWNGQYPNQTPCPAGVYYFHCTYIDLTGDDGGEKKSLSGMIELKN